MRFKLTLLSLLALFIVLAPGCNKTTPQDMGAECQSKDDCKSSQCLTMPMGTKQVNRCSAKCKTDRDCESGKLVCHSGINFCVVPDGKAIGEACEKSDDCDHGLCAQDIVEHTGYCTELCLKDSDCEEGFTCKDEFTPRQKRVKFCQR